MLSVVDVLELRVLPAFVVFRVMFLDQLPVVDRTTPSAGLDLLHLDVGLEAGQVTTHGALYVAHPPSRLLDQRAWLDVERDLNAGEVGSELVEGDDARVDDALVDAPLDSFVGSLLDDLAGELLRHAPDLRPEGDGAVVLLRRLIEAVHELRPFLELGPLVVGGRKRHADIHGLLDWHPPA